MYLNLVITGFLALLGMREIFRGQLSIGHSLEQLWKAFTVGLV